MVQGVLPFNYEEEKNESGMTALRNLPVYLDLAQVMGVGESIERHFRIKQQGWTDKQILLSSDCSHVGSGCHIGRDDEAGEAYHSYKRYKAYRAINTWWTEQGLVLHTD
jgi:hypothetical protein